MRKEKKPVQRKMGLLNLATGEQVVVDDIESFSFSPAGTYLAMKRYGPEKKETVDAASAPDTEDTPGATLILRQLGTAHDATFGNVSEFAWQDLPKSGTLLAMAINSEDKAGNGVQIFNSETAAVRVLDSSSSTYSGLAWRKDSADLAILRSKTDERHEGPTQIALAWTHLTDASEAGHSYDPAADAKFPAGIRTVAYRKPSWSEDGDVVFLGVAKWDEKLPEAKKAAGGKDSSAVTEKDKDEEEPAGVDIWNWRDAEVMPKQKLNAKNDREKNMLAAWHVGNGEFVQLGKDLDEEVTPIKHSKMAYATNWAAYTLERTIGRPAADLYLVDVGSGDRTKVKERLIDDYYIRASPNGRYILYVEDDNYWTVDVATKAVVNITKNVHTSFVDKESDETIKQKPAFGLAGWTKNDAAVILYDKFDLWQVASDGSGQPGLPTARRSRCAIGTSD